MRSIVIIIICFLSYLIIHQTEQVVQKVIPFTHDQAGYYNYLPALVLYQDMQFSYLKDLPKSYHFFTSTVLDKTKKEVKLNPYGIGVAVLISPFFGLAHLHAKLFEFPLDGFSAPYQIWIYVGHFFYLLLAFLLLRQILSRYYKDKVIASVLLIIGLGTNLTYYVLYEPLMSHNYSFFIFSLALFLMIKWLENQQKSTLLFLGLTVGLLAATRFTNILYLIVLFLWDIASWNALKGRLRLLIKHKTTFSLAVFLGIVVFLPQMWYWYLVTGYWWINPYGDRGVFFWTDPLINEVLWGYKKGWLLYSPLIAFGMVGFLFLYRQFPQLFGAVLSYTLLNWYVISCWWCWWYGGSFGMRALIESMAPLSLTIAAFLHWAFQSKWRQVSCMSLIGLGIGLNLFQTYQYTHNCIHNFAMTRKSYWAVFGQIPPLSPEVAKEYNRYLLGAYMNEMTQESREETKTYNARSEK